MAFVQNLVKSEVFQDRQVNNLFILNFAILGSNAILMPVRESLTLEGGKALQTKLMMLTVVASIVGQAMFAYYSGKYGGLETLRGCLFISSLFCFVTYGCLVAIPRVSILLSSMFYLWFTFYNMTSMSTFWAIAGDVLEESQRTSTTSDKVKQEEEEEEKNGNNVGAKSLTNGSHKSKNQGKHEKNGSSSGGQVVKKIGVFSLLGAGGTLGGMTGSYSVSVLIKWIGSLNTLVFLGIAFMLSITLCHRIEQVTTTDTTPTPQLLSPTPFYPMGCRAAYIPLLPLFCMYPHPRLMKRLSLCSVLSVFAPPQRRRTRDMPRMQAAGRQAVRGQDHHRLRVLSEPKPEPAKMQSATRRD